MRTILDVKDLTISFTGNDIPAVNGISFSLAAGELTAVVGESGSGKSVTALSILQLLPEQATVNGSIYYYPENNKSVTLTNTTRDEIRMIRGNRIAMIFQEPMTSLNPVYTCGYQVMESLLQHKNISKKEAREAVIELFQDVELPDPAAMLDRYPHEISGGQKQRVMIAMAMSCQPDILVADEPTTALDVRVQGNILKLLKKLQSRTGMSVLLITHDLGLVAEVADKVIVMYKGMIVEHGDASDVLHQPQHLYTKALLACRPAAAAKGTRLAVIKDFQEGSIRTTATNALPVSDEIILSVKDLHVHYGKRHNIFAQPKQAFKAVDGVSFDIHQNEIVGLVGESGCGKTTLGRAILQLVKPTSGTVVLDGKDLTKLSADQLRIIRKELQIVFQDPYGSLNPRLTIGDAIMEPMRVHKIENSNKVRKEKVINLLNKVDLSADHFKRYPHEFSGGQRQRICIARALALDPTFLVFDESVSALDVSVQAQVLNLINDLKASYRFTAIFISHDLSVVHYLCNRILVMQKGKIVEEGTADQVYKSPAHEYTQQLINAIPGRTLTAF